MSVKRAFYLENLDCANCAAKISNKLNSLDKVKSANIDFFTLQLQLELESEKDFEEILPICIKEARKIETDINILPYETITNRNLNKKDLQESNNHEEKYSDESDNHKKDNYNKNNIKIMKIIISFCILVVSILLEDEIAPYALFMMLVASYLIVGFEVLNKSITNIMNGQIFDENFLMSIATIGAFAIGEWSEGVGVMLFYAVGELFQDMAVDKSRKSITSLMDIRPDYANLLNHDSTTTMVGPSTVNVGDMILIKPGEKIPLDCIVRSGEGMIDTVSLTGEAVPRKVSVSDTLLSGCINVNGLITAEVTTSFNNSTVVRILNLVENANMNKSKTENFITKFARIYTPVVCFLALAISLIPPIFISGEGFTEWVYKGLSFLVVSCPCALVISIPLGFFGGIGNASKNGILVKGSNYLEALNDVKTVVFDKTGTLTKGVFTITDIVPSSDGKWTKEEILYYAALSESYSLHPIAKSIIEYYGKDINQSLISNYEEISGHGIVNTIMEGNKKDKQSNQIIKHHVCIGNDKLMKRFHIQYDNVNSYKTIIHIAIDGKYAGHLVISDVMKEDAKDAIRLLKKQNINTIMLTGDIKLVAEAVGKALDIDKVYSELLPADKVSHLEEALTSTSDKVAFVGDGINDAPVLARADVGIAMGGVGSDAAIEAADVVIMTDEPYKINTAISIARNTRSIVMQNIVLALGVKALIMIIVASGHGNMWFAVFADVGVAILAILNSVRALHYKPN